MFDRLSQWISDRILQFLNKPTFRYAPFFALDPQDLLDVLLPGDVILVEGNTRLSSIIKYLTQSTWSHAGLYIGDAKKGESGTEANVFLEADVETGVVTVPISHYARFNTRICRPVGLTADERRKVIDYAMTRIGEKYDRKRVIDLARFLLPHPPVPVALRRRMLSVGARDPTKAICSGLIADAFLSIRYPILPERAVVNGVAYGIAPYVQSEIEHIRKHGLFTPRDFDVSPYFAVIKPLLDRGFDYHALVWEPDDTK